jgi:hypothetical protein
MPSSKKVRESFHTVQAIHRKQKRLKLYYQVKPCSKNEGGDADTKADDDVYANTETNCIEDDIAGAGNLGVNADGDDEDNDHISDSNQHRLERIDQEDLRSQKFEAAVAAAVAAESEISALTNGIAELERILLEQDHGESPVNERFPVLSSTQPSTSTPQVER